VDCLPLDTRRAMLAGIASNRIIVGAYVDRKGGVCPMLAAHRNGGRTNLASFARAWDRYTKANGRPRPATERELRTLTVMLEASIAIDDGGADELRAVAAEHWAAKARRARAETGERDRTAELRRRPGWSWLRPFRRLDEYERALREIDHDRQRERERQPV
jgi:hypothetical protein